MMAVLLPGGTRGSKLRLIVDGEFGETGTPSGVRIDNLSVSNNNEAFFKFGN